MFHHSHSRAVALLELVMVFAMIAVMAGVLLPAMAAARRRSDDPQRELNH